MSANFSSFEVRSPVFEPSTPRRAGRAPNLSTAWFIDPQSPIASSKQPSPTGIMRAGTPTRATTPRQVVPFSPMYRSSAVFGTGSRVATPVRRVGSPRGTTPSSPSAVYSRTNSGTPTAFQRTNSSSTRIVGQSERPPERLFAERPSTPILLRSPMVHSVMPTVQRAATPVQARSARPQTPLDACTVAESVSSHGATETSFVSSPSFRSVMSGGAGVRDVLPSRLRAASPLSSSFTIGDSAFHQYLQQQQQQQQQQQMAVPRGVTSPAAPSTAENIALLNAFVDRWNNRYTENQNNYREGGYMAVTAGDVLKQRYVMLQKLGWGEFSTVWLAFDKSPADQRNAFVAIKIAKCSNSVSESTKYEIALLHFLHQSLPSTSPLTHLLDAFEHKGPYGMHQCFVMAVHGSNMLCVIDQMKARKRKRSDKEVALIKDITSSILRGLEHLESVNVIHTDLKPENVIASVPDPKIVKIIEGFLARNPKLNREVLDGFSDGNGSSVVLADFGLSVLLEPPAVASKLSVGSKKEFKVHVPGIVSNVTGTLIQTREYRAPEILFGADFNARTDIWSLGCMCYELITGDFLVDPKKKTRDEREMDVEHLAMIMQIIGPVPHRIACSSRGTGAPKYIHRFFNEHGQFHYAEKYKRYPRRSLAAELEVYLEPSEAERAAQFIMSCFTYDPMERCNATDLLKHSWLK